MLLNAFMRNGSHPIEAIRAERMVGIKKPCHSVRPPARARASAKQQMPQPDPLYLFYCALQWHKERDTSAGWELVQGMRSQDRGVRALAAELLAETENGRLLVRDLRRTRSGLQQIAVSPKPRG